MTSTTRERTTARENLVIEGDPGASLKSPLRKFTGMKGMKGIG